MPTKTTPSEAAQMCATVLAICSGYFEQANPNAKVLAEITPGDWQPIHLATAIDHALEMFRDEHGETV